MRALAVLAVAVTLLAAGRGDARAPSRWIVERGTSAVTMEVRAFGGSHGGTFETWTSELMFDPDQPAATRLAVTVQAGSLRMRPAVATARAIGPAFLDAARYPTIGFRLKTLEPAAAGRFNATADVTIRGRTRSLAFPADLRVEGGAAHMTGALTIDRADFDIGMQGPWNRLVGRQVTVRVMLTARPAG